MDCIIYANFVGKMIFKTYEFLVLCRENWFSSFTNPGSVLGSSVLKNKLMRVFF